MDSSIPDAPRPRIFVDADACPKQVKDIIFKFSSKRGLIVVFVSNKYQQLSQQAQLFQVIVKAGPDEADMRIIEMCDNRDLVVTADIPLAAELVANNVIAINPRGEVYTDTNIGNRLATRNLMSDLRSDGMVTGGPKGYSDRDKQKFAASLDKYLTKLQGKIADK